MKFNPFEQIAPTINDVKRLLFPFRLRHWLKLGFVAMLAGNVRSGGGGGPNVNIPLGANRGNQTAGNATSKITGSAVDGLKSTLGGFAYLIIPVLVLLFTVMLVLGYISSVFTFIFLEALHKRKVQIKKSWKQQQSLGVSWFLFRILLGVILILVIGLFALPFIIPLITEGWAGFTAGFSLASLAWIIPLASLLIILFILFALFMALVFHFSTVHMYFNKLPVWVSVKATFRKIGKAKLEVFLFLIARLLIGIVLGIAVLVILLILLLPFALVAAPFALMFWGIGLAMIWSIPLIVVAVLFGIAYLIVWLYIFSVCFLPFSTYSRYFSIRNYKLLMK